MKPVTNIGLSKLHATLAEMGACGLGVFDGPNKSELKLYSVNGQTIIVQIWSDEDGFEVYAPITTSLSVQATIDALKGLAKPIVSMKATENCDLCGGQHGPEHDCQNHDYGNEDGTCSPSCKACQNTRYPTVDHRKYGANNTTNTGEDGLLPALS